MKLAKWQKPGSDETRVYFNGLYEAENRGIKVYAIENAGAFQICFSKNLYPSQQDAIMDRIDSELADKNGGVRVTTWAELLRFFDVRETGTEA